MKNQDKLFGRYTKRLIKEKGIRQMDIAARLDVDPSHVSYALSGKYIPNEHFIKVVARLTGAEYDFLRDLADFSAGRLPQRDLLPLMEYFFGNEAINLINLITE